MSEKQPYRTDGHCLVAQVSNLLYRRLPVGWACDLGSASNFSSASAMRAASGLEIRDTADWKSALRRECIRPPDPCRCKRQHRPTGTECLRLRPLAQGFDVGSRAVAEPAIELGLVFQLLAAQPGHHHEPAVHLGERRQVAPQVLELSHRERILLALS